MSVDVTEVPTVHAAFTPLPILSLTSKEYATAIAERLGKGTQHALLIYQEFFRSGKVTGAHPAFSNAKRLFQDIVACTDFTGLSCFDKGRDGKTEKVLLATADGLEVESVLIPMKAGGTLCVSSQVGCKMGCTFCETGRMGLIRHLTAKEIVSQLLLAKFTFGFHARNVVFMGMGEPFDNYVEVMQAFKVMHDPNGFGFGPNHITISTSGRVDGILKLLDEVGPIPHLAVSLNAPNDALRRSIMPITRQYPLATLYDAMKRFCEATRKNILIAYVMMKDKNDSVAHAEELANYLQGLSVTINLIPYNHQSIDRFKTSECEAIARFAHFLIEAGFNTRIRQTKGDKIMAACGQLGNAQQKAKLVQLRK